MKEWQQKAKGNKKYIQKPKLTKKRKETKNTIKTQSELSKAKVPRINKKLETEIQIERSAKKRREHTAAYIRIMQQIISAIKMTQLETKNFIDFLINTLPTLKKQQTPCWMT